jgi:hypothetical protein
LISLENHGVKTIKEMPKGMMKPGRFVALCFYMLVAVPIVLLVGLALMPVTRRWRKTERVACRNCGYSMPAIERACPKCRATVR